MIPTGGVRAKAVALYSLPFASLFQSRPLPAKMEKDQLVELVVQLKVRVCNVIRLFVC